MDNNFSWVDTHKRIVQYLSDKENSQQELIDLLKSIGITAFNDRSKPGRHDIELREIDPFTFFCYIHKYGPKRALGFLQQIAERLDLEKPTTVNGVPSAEPRSVWLFPPDYLRVNNEVSRLWNLFKKELKDDIDDDAFADALDIKNVGKAKLTEALFYVSPEKYLPINGPTKPYIKEVLGLDYQFSTYSEYTKLLEKIREKTDVPFYELSHEAWVWNKANGEPQVNDVIQSMIEDYKKHIAKTQLKNELFKWELIEKFKGRPNLDVEDSHEEIKSIDYSNLMFHMSKAVINDLTEKKPEETRKLFEMLFDEFVDLAKRIKDFSKSTKELYRALGETNQHHQDERAISTYLTYKYPEEYTFYKYSYYNSYCKLLGIKKAKINERYAHYLSLIDELIENHIKSDSELIEQVKSYIPQYYDGTNHKLLAQDILFQTERRNAKENYWVFQGNPDNFDFETAFQDDLITGWTVTSHKDKIEAGDKVIIWVTGNKSGCYALADVVSEPMDRESFLDSHLWKIEDTSELKAAIKITHNLSDNPILQDEIDGIKELAKLNVGHQGTNFTATKEEYDTLLELAMERESLINYRDSYINWLRIKYGNRLGTINSYEKAIDVLSKILSVDIFEISDIKYLDSLYKDLIKEQRNENGRYYHPDAPSYGNNGFYSASINSYMEFLNSRQKTVKPNKKQVKRKNQETTPTNTILYGPPGTGKTYNTVNEALRIIDNIFLEENNDNRKALNERFRSLRFNPETGEGQVAFITFHQSLSYEDFIEGIKPVKSENNDDVKYEVCDGIFKSIAKVASKKRVDLSFDENYEQFTNYVMEQGAFSLETPVQKKPFKVRINGSGNCVAIPQTETATEMVIAKEWIEEYLQDGTVRDWKPYLSSIASYISANYNNEVKQVDNTTKSYVIIIDEINRGNISQIFGELITLIEPDKRKGQAEEIEVILPYSKERFSVPSNLHIIGTMNTADRSVEALDTALRRRFSFMEMNPEPSLLNSEEFSCEGIDLNAMLEAINGRIEKLLDKDYCIGHSYFMTIKNKQKPLEELKYIFQNKILPLLQEYFYGDWGKIRLIVGKEFVDMKKSNGVKFLDVDSVDDYEEFDEKPIYNFTNHKVWTLDSFKTIYEQA